MATQYPAKIDNNSTLPEVVDGVTSISGVSVNRLREAILAIQTELGTKPSSIYTNVKTRLDNLEELLANGAVFIAGGDLYGTSSDQKISSITGDEDSTLTVLATKTIVSGDGYYTVNTNVVSLTTNDGYLSDIYTWDILEDAITVVDVSYSALSADLTQSATYLRRRRFLNNGGTVSAGDLKDLDTDEDDEDWDVDLDFTGTTGKVSVQGADGVEIKWGVTIQISETYF